MQVPAVPAPDVSAPVSPDAAQSPTACLPGLVKRYGERVRVAPPPARPAADAACAVVEPVIVEALQIGGKAVVFQPAVTLSCETAGKVADWVGLTLLPLTRGVFGRDLASLRVGGGHECRRRNRASAGPLSEHATGRALDIFGFVLEGAAPGAMVSVEKPVGEQERDYLAAVRQSACGAFNTAIGPGADAAHANHIHVDIQARRAASTRFCQ